jgi:uncharacterized protein YjbK
MKKPSREIEFKFGVPGKQAFYQLVEHLYLPESLLSAGVTQVNHFFDSTSLCLHNQHCAIRLREETGKYQLTVKGDKQHQPDENRVLSNRVEEEAVIPALTAVDLLHGKISPQQAIREHFDRKSASVLSLINTACNDQNLVHIGEFSNVRIHLPPVALPDISTGEKLEFELDSSTFPNGSIDHEIEVEIAEHTDAANIQAALIDLLQRAGIEWHTAPSKAERFFDAVSRLPDTN